MPKVKPKRHAPGIDMTAMVDVAFLLLTFFILTTKFKADEKAVVDPPSAHNVEIVSGVDVINVSVDKDGKIFMGMASQQERLDMLDRMIERFGFSVPETGRNYFKNLNQFGVGVAELPSWLSLPVDKMKEYPQNGIPVNTTKGALNEFKEWMIACRRSNPKARIILKGDRELGYPNMDKVISTMQDMNINQFNLLVNQEGGDAEKKPAEAPTEGS